MILFLGNYERAEIRERVYAALAHLTPEHRADANETLFIDLFWTAGHMIDLRNTGRHLEWICQCDQ